ncbi:MAG TPA: HlyD family efflux transporter periplasmic adaptor subunit [Balneolaceae bacterium]|nr:HlyD family efflux transporter periplasmic adaptor subunit [Balneolaceae bacterium]
MDHKLFPEEIINNSAEANFYKHSIKTKLIYNSAGIFVVAILAILPFVYINVSIKSPGVIKPITERNHLISLVSGKIKKLYIHENESVEEGEKVAEIAAPMIDEKLNFNKQQQIKIKTYLADLSKLEAIDSSSIFKSLDLKTAKYNQSLLQFKQQARNAFQNVKKISRKFWRDEKLYKRQFLSKAAYEKTFFSLQTTRSELLLLFKQQKNKWRSQEITYKDKLEELETEREQFTKQLQEHIIKAPVSGSVQNIQGLYEGSYVSANQTLAEISPDTGLIVECYVPPQKIGLIKKGMVARFQVSAFDYNQWGILTGKVQEISNDVSVINNQPVFKVRSTLNKPYLELGNGYKGMLKKGMTLQARFKVARRSLFQLLYDNIDDWLNPIWDNHAPTNRSAI